MVSYGSKLAEFHAKPSLLIHHFLRDFPNKNGCPKGSRIFFTCVTHYGIYSLLSNIYEFWQRSKPHNKYNGCNYIVKLLGKPILNNKWVQESAQWSVIKITANPITIYCMLVKEEASLYRLARVIKNGWLLLVEKKWATDFYHPRKKFHNESLVIWFLEVCKSSVKRVIC